MPIPVIAAALAGVQHDVVADFVGRFGEDENPGDEIRQRVLGGEADGDGEHAGGRQPRGHVHAPGLEREVQRNREDDQEREVFEQRQGLPADQLLVVGMSHRGLEQNPRQAHEEHRPDENVGGLEDGYRGALNASAEGRHRQRDRQPHHQNRVKNRLVQDGDNFAVNLEAGFASEPQQAPFDDRGEKICGGDGAEQDDGPLNPRSPLERRQRIQDADLERVHQGRSFLRSRVSRLEVS